MPLPLIVVRIDILEPAKRSEKIDLSISVHVRHADPVAILLFTAYVMNLGLALGKVDPDNSGVVVVCERNIGFAVAVDVGKCAALGVVAIRDQMSLPHRVRALRVLVPPESVDHPPSRDHVGRSIVIHVDGPFAAVGDELPQDADGAILMTLPTLHPTAPGFSYQ